MIRRSNKISSLFFITGIWIVSACVWVYQSVREYSGPMLLETPEELFQLLIENPIPKSIKYLEAAGDSWEGFSVYMRFTASRLFISSYTSAHFDETPCWLIDSFLALHSHEYDIFVPSWTPEKVMHPQCFQSRGEIGVKWIGTQYLLVDYDYNLVYIHAVGDSQ